MEWLLEQIDAKSAEVIQMLEPNQGLLELDDEKCYYRKLEKAVWAHQGLCKANISSLVNLQ